MARQDAYAKVAPADADYITGVDASDPTQDPGGSTKNFLFSAVWAYIASKLSFTGTTQTAVSAAGGLTEGEALVVDENGDVISEAVLDLQFTGDTLVVPSVGGTGVTENGILRVLADGNVQSDTPAALSLVSSVPVIVGADAIPNIVSLTQAEYDGDTPAADTLYIITDAV